jgi:hypothetical protein
LVLALVIAGGVIWFFVWGSSPKRHTIAVDPSKTPPAALATPQMRVRRPPRPISAVNKISDNKWRVQGDSGGLAITKSDTGALDFVFFYPQGLPLAADQTVWAAARYRILHDDAMAKEWGITPEQIEKIRKIDTSVTVKAAPSDENNVRTLWNAYEKAGDGQAKTDAEKKLIEAVNQAGKNALEATKTAYIEQLKLVQGALTADQVAKITKR